MGFADCIGKYWVGAEVTYGDIMAMTFPRSLRGHPKVLSPGAA
jgi:hypothetical protein